MESSLSLTKCVIKKNNASSGGGVNCSSAINVKITDSEIIENTAGTNTEGSGGGLEFDYCDNITLLNCNISKNTTRGGGGIYVHNVGRTTLVNCLLSENEQNSGALLVSNYTNDFSHGSAQGTTTLVNCTVACNTGGGH